MCCFLTNFYCCLFRYDPVRNLLDTPSYASMRAQSLVFDVKVEIVADKCQLGMMNFDLFDSLTFINSVYLLISFQRVVTTGGE